MGGQESKMRGRRLDILRGCCRLIRDWTVRVPLWPPFVTELKDTALLNPSVTCSMTMERKSRIRSYLVSPQLIRPSPLYLADGSPRDTVSSVKPSNSKTRTNLNIAHDLCPLKRFIPRIHSIPSFSSFPPQSLHNPIIRSSTRPNSLLKFPHLLQMSRQNSERNHPRFRLFSTVHRGEMLSNRGYRGSEERCLRHQRCFLYAMCGEMELTEGLEASRSVWSLVRLVCTDPNSVRIEAPLWICEETSVKFESKSSWPRFYSISECQ